LEHLHHAGIGADLGAQRVDFALQVREFLLKLGLGVDGELRSVDTGIGEAILVGGDRGEYFGPAVLRGHQVDCA
jgi:hypothetical protein